MIHTQSIDDQERLDRLRLIRSENVGPVTFRQLLIRYKTAAAALEALPTLARRGGRRSRLRIAQRSDAEAELAALTAMGGRMLHIGQADYPSLLSAVDDAPPVLSVLGHPHLLTGRCIAIVGSRNASTNGKMLARRFAEALGAEGLTIASGLARGIDTAVHHGALGTGTIAVVAGGVDVIYPKENASLHRDLVERGAILSERPLGAVGQARHFPRRNRIISGLSTAVIVLEATLESGSLITARLAAEQGREVMAVPGSPMDPRARGANDLIRGGATLVETPEEAIRILRDLPEDRLDAPDADAFDTAPVRDDDNLDAPRKAIADALSPTAVAVDDLIADLDLPPRIVATVLIELELAGIAERHPGGRVSLLIEDPT